MESKDFIDSLKNSAVPLFKSDGGGQYMQVASDGDQNHLLIRLNFEQVFGETPAGEPHPAIGLGVRFISTVPNPELPSPWRIRRNVQVMDKQTSGVYEECTHLNHMVFPMLSPDHGPKEMHDRLFSSGVTGILDDAVATFAQANGLVVQHTTEQIMHLLFDSMTDPVVTMKVVHWQSTKEFKEYQQKLVGQWKAKMGYKDQAADPDDETGDEE